MACAAHSPTWASTVLGPGQLCGAGTKHHWQGRQDESRHIRDALRETGDVDLIKRADKMQLCSTYGIIQVPLQDPTAAQWLPASCDQQLCTICHGHQVRLTSRRLRWILHGETPAFRGTDGRVRQFTLTHRRGWLREGPRAAYKVASANLLKLRMRKAWKRHVVGGMASFEAIYTPEGWNPHWHVLCVGTFWRSMCHRCQRHDVHRCAVCRKKAKRGHRVAWVRKCDRDDPCLSCEWSAVTGGSFMVDAREIKEEGLADAKREQVKYVTKPQKLVGDAVEQWFVGMRRVRRFRWFGSWEGIRVPVDYTPRVFLRASSLYRLAHDCVQQVVVDGGVAELHELMQMPEHNGLQLCWSEGDPKMGQLRSSAYAVIDADWARTAYAAVSLLLSRPPPDQKRAQFDLEQLPF